MRNVDVQQVIKWASIVLISATGVLVGALVALNKTYDVKQAITSVKQEAIRVGVAEFVITNKLTGASEFRWKTNNVKSSLF